MNKAFCITGIYNVRVRCSRAHHDVLFAHRTHVSDTVVLPVEVVPKVVGACSKECEAFCYLDRDEDKTSLM